MFWCCMNNKLNTFSLGDRQGESNKPIIYTNGKIKGIQRH